MPETITRPLYEIAFEIRADWPKMSAKPDPALAWIGGGVHPARPYVDAMSNLVDLDQEYGLDSAESIVRYFLSNAGQWRGETARRIKAELKALLK